MATIEELKMATTKNALKEVKREQRRCAEILFYLYRDKYSSNINDEYINEAKEWMLEEYEHIQIIISLNCHYLPPNMARAVAKKFGIPKDKWVPWYKDRKDRK